MHSSANVRNQSPVYGRMETAESVKDAVCNFSALLSAEKRCHKNVGYKDSVSSFHMTVLSNVYKLRQELLEGKYKTRVGQSFTIYEPKRRTVTSTPYKDRIPQASLVMNFYYPYIEPHLSPCSYACLKGRGVDAARNKLKEILRDASPDDYILKVDFTDYFGSINHEVLLGELSEYFPDEWTREYHEDIYGCNGKETGLSLGSEINQLSAVTLPTKMDRELAKGPYARYMDDLVVCGDRAWIEHAYATICAEADRLRLKISEKKTYIQPVTRPVRFLGFSFLRHPTGRVTVKRLPEKLKNEKRRLRRMKKSGVPIESVLEHYQSVRATMKHGERSGVVKLDRYFNNLFKEELQNECRNQ